MFFVLSLPISVIAMLTKRKRNNFRSLQSSTQSYYTLSHECVTVSLLLDLLVMKPMVQARYIFHVLPSNMKHYYSCPSKISVILYMKHY